MASRHTGFHPSDADWTRGREQALAEANSIARRQDGLARVVSIISRAAEIEAEANGLSRLSDRQESATIIVGGCSPAERVLPLSRFTPASPKAVRRFYGAAHPAST